MQLLSKAQPLSKAHLLSKARHSKGATLIELVIAIVIAGIILSGMFSAYSRIMGRTADPMIAQQSLLIAKALLEEIMLKPYLDPDDASTCVAPTGARASWDNVCDYNGYTSTGVEDQEGNTYPGLNQYSIAVSVIPAVGANNSLGNIVAAHALKVQVTVNNILQRPVVLTAWRACYESGC